MTVICLYCTAVFTVIYKPYEILNSFYVSICLTPKSRFIFWAGGVVKHSFIHWSIHSLLHSFNDTLNTLFLTLHCRGYMISKKPRPFAHGAMGCQIDPSWGGPIELFLVPASAPDWCNKGCGMCYPVCGIVHVKEPLLLIGKISLCGSSGFPFSPYVWRHITIIFFCYVRH